MADNSTAAGRYSQLETYRSPFLERARECAEVTIPSLLPRQGHSAATKMPTPWQGMGARGVNNLGSKLLLALLPPNSPFFRFRADEYAVEELTGGNDKAKAEVEEALGKMERSVMTKVETGAFRVSVFEAIKQLIVAGNVLLYMPKQGGIKVYRLDRYVVKRDPMGNVLEIIIKESVSPQMVDPSIRALIGADKSNSPEKSLDLYTRITRDGDRLRFYQEVGGVIIPDSRGFTKVENSPWIALRWAKIDGEDYGRGHVEEYLGDLLSLEGLNKAIVEGAALAARVVILVNPNGQTKQKDVATAPNGAVRPGKADDVSMLQAEKFADFRIAADTIDKIEDRLAAAFLLVQSITRQAERVTAEEVRRMAGELEDALGGIYSTLSQEFQLPFLNRLIFLMEQNKELPELPKDIVRPAITTGLEALGRGHDLNRFSTFSSVAQQVLSPEIFAQYVDASAFLKVIATSLSIDVKGLIKSEDQLKAERAQAQQQKIIETMGPELIKSQPTAPPQ